MGEEEKKVEENKVEDKKVEEKKTVEDVEKREEAKSEKEKSSDEAPMAKVEEESPKEPTPAPLPPSPPQEIVLRVYMHCEGCAKKVKRCLKGFEGVEDVTTDCKTHKVVVKGEKADPLKVLERVERKSHRKVELLSPRPPPPTELKKAEDKAIPEAPEKKEEPQVITVVLGVHMHCEACAHHIKKRIQRIKGVENVNTDLKNSEVKVKGVFEASNLVEYLYKRTGKHAIILVKQEPEKKEETKEEQKVDEGSEKKVEEPPAVAVAVAVDGKAEAEEKKAEGAEKEGAKGDKEGAKAEEMVTVAPADSEKEGAKGSSEMMELVKNEFYYYYPPNYQIYPPRVVCPYPPAPQIFSDENPNACSVM